MDIPVQLLRDFGEMQFLLQKKEFEKCEKILTRIIQSNNQNLSAVENEFNIMLIKKRISVHKELGNTNGILSDIQLLQNMNVVLNWNDEIFLLKQESIINSAIKEVIKNLNDLSCNENRYMFESTKQALSSISTKAIFDIKQMNGPIRKKSA